jgi:xylulokinase
LLALKEFPLKYLLGFDIGSSSVKVALLEASTGKTLCTAFSPSVEMEIVSPKAGFAEQDPNTWWVELGHAMEKIRDQVKLDPDEVIAIGISYQMHGLVCVNSDLKVLRPAIIWCDSRAVEIGNRAFRDLGEDFCLHHYLNSPGNFTASKLKWVKENEPDVYEKIYLVLLPGDYIAMKLTGVASTTVSGLSEGIFWDFEKSAVAASLLEYYGIDPQVLAPVVPTFGEQGNLLESAADFLGLKAGIPVSYRAGDQPNNAYSLNVLRPGEIAATAGTSGVVYGVTDQTRFDQQSRVNTFVHVNHSAGQARHGILLCINGTGILNSWLRNNFFADWSYQDMNEAAARVPIGACDLQFFPFGNGAERILANREPGSWLRGLQFNTHKRGHIARAAQEGIVFAMHYGTEIMGEMGMTLNTIRAGHANMFLSEVFGQTFANLAGCTVELYNTDGAVGAARGAGVGAGYYTSLEESFTGMKVIRKIEPEYASRPATIEAYNAWKHSLKSFIQ